ncbi:MAG: helix-turn-helix transcriptional regulator [Actinomycetota bacterium]|nr:helix-turn-helix transcriptional regulator [Actinomycetota bacterium]
MKEPGPERLVATQLKAIRKRRGLSQEALADSLAVLGVVKHQTVIAKIEARARGVAVDELVALAVALNVTPLALLLPDSDSPGDMVEITPRGSARADQVWAWARGDRPLSLYDSRIVGPLQGLPQLSAEAEREQYVAELPQTERRLRAHPIVQQATQVLAGVRRLALELPDGMAPSSIELELQRVRHAVQRLAAELDAVEVEFKAWRAEQ